jgi:hypothetical protein
VRARHGERKAGKAKGFSLKVLRIRLKLIEGYSGALPIERQQPSEPVRSAGRLEGAGMASCPTARASMERHIDVSRVDRVTRSPRH